MSNPQPRILSRDLRCPRVAPDQRVKLSARGRRFRRHAQTCVESGLLAAWLSAGACYAYRPVALAPAPGARVRIVFTSAIVAATFQPGPDSTRQIHPGVLEASGTINAAARDTVALHLGELRTAAGAVPGVSGRVALLPTAQIARIEERRFQAGTTVLAGVGASALALTALVILLTVAITKGF